MIVDFFDPASIAAWYRIAPERHGPQLAAMAKIQPQYAQAIRLAGNLLRTQKQAPGKRGKN